MARSSGGALAVTAAVWVACLCANARDLAAVHLPGNIASDAQVGLAVVANQALYAAYWEGTNRSSSQLMARAIDLATEKAAGQTLLAEEQLGDMTSQHVRLFPSEDGSLLLCVASGITAGKQLYLKMWTLRTRDLQIVSYRDLSAMERQDPAFWGFERDGNIRLSTTPGWKEFDQVTVTDLAPQNLGKEVSKKVVRLKGLAWMQLAVGRDNLIWVLMKQKSPEGNKVIAAYRLDDGRLAATRQVISGEGVPYGLTATNEGVLVQISQPPTADHEWSHLLRFDLDSPKGQRSTTVIGCDMGSALLSRNGRVAVAGCESIQRSVLDQYVIKKMEAVLISAQSGTILSLQPLNKTNSTSLAVDENGRSILVAVYDRRATVRLVSVPQ